MVSPIQVTYETKDNVDVIDMQVGQNELTDFLTMLSRKYNKLYTVECSSHVVIGFGGEDKKVIVKVFH